MSGDEKPKIIIPDELFANVPPEDRDRVRAEIEAQFSGPGPLDVEPVPELPPGTTHCPRCNRPLEIIALNRQAPNTPAFDILGCLPCDMDYVTLTRVQ